MGSKAISTILLIALALGIAHARQRRFAEEPEKTSATPDTESRQGLSDEDQALLKQLYGGGFGGDGPVSGLGAPNKPTSQYGDPCHVPPPPLGGLGSQEYPQTLPEKPGQQYPQTVPGGPGQPYPQTLPGGPGQPYPQIVPGRPGYQNPQTLPTGPNQPYPQVVPGGPGSKPYPPSGANPVDPLGPYPSIGGGIKEPGQGKLDTYGPPQPLPAVGGPGKLPDASGYGPGKLPDAGGYGPGKLPDASGYGPGKLPDAGEYGPGRSPGAGGYAPPSSGVLNKEPYTDTKPSKGHDIPVLNDKCLHPYECVPFYLCKEGDIVDNGEGIIDVRSYGGAEEKLVGGNCANFLDVCCKKPMSESDEQMVTPPFQSQCGKRNEEGLAVRIAFQNQSYLAETQFGEFPWMAAVLRTVLSPPDSKGHREEYDEYQCGGSLIHPQVVMTAAHCVDKYKVDIQALKVRLGEWDTQREDYEPYPHEDRRVTKVVTHEKFAKSTLFNDVALLFLDQPASLYHHIDTICLPDYGSNFEGSECTVTGWGKNNFGKAGSYQEVLKRIDLPVVSNYDCQHALRGTKLGRYFRLHPSFMCAGGEPDKDACQGDGGSPLVCFDKYRKSYVQVGIVAWGIGCGQNGIPGVYADVIQQVDWINGVVTEYFAMDKPYFDLRKAEERIAAGLKEGDSENKV